MGSVLHSACCLLAGTASLAAVLQGERFQCRAVVMQLLSNGTVSAHTAGFGT